MMKDLRLLSRDRSDGFGLCREIFSHDAAQREQREIVAHAGGVVEQVSHGCGVAPRRKFRDVAPHRRLPPNLEMRSPSMILYLETPIRWARRKKIRVRQSWSKKSYSRH